MEPLRFSHLKQFAKSPAHYQCAVTTDGDEQTYDMERGSAVHAVVFGTQRVIGYPGKVRNGKEWEAFEAANSDALILTRNEYEKSMRMAEAIWAHKQAMEILTGVAEKTLRFDYLGRACRGTPDIRAEDWIAELKTSSTSEPDRFTWHALRMHYHAQLAFYLHGVSACGLGDHRSAFVVAVEASAPFPITVLRLTDRAIEQGERLVRLWYERLRSCEESNAWPPYVQSVIDLDVPEDFELEFGEDDEPEAGAA